MNLFWERVFYILTYIAQGLSFLTPRAYVILHTRHHKYSDTEKDPHSPHHQSNIFAMMIKTFHDFESIRLHPEDHQEEHRSLDYPVWLRFERLAESKPARAIWLGLIVFIYYLLNAPWWCYTLIPLHIAIGPIQGAIVNWFGHKRGYTNFKNGDMSKNTLFVDVLLMGELYQNNHHRSPKSINFAHRSFEFDITYYLIKLLGRLNIIKINELSIGQKYIPSKKSLHHQQSSI